MRPRPLEPPHPALAERARDAAVGADPAGVVAPAGAVARLAERQSGVVTREQLRRSGLSDAAIGRWARAGRLHRVHPRVYAVGHRALSTEGALAAALLYAGPGAALSHGTAAWWWQLLPEPPGRIHVSSRRRMRSLRDVAVHPRDQVERAWHGRFPVSPVPQALLDLAATAPLRQLRRAVAEAFHLGLVDAGAVEAVLGRGRTGSRALREALRRHTPELARTLSELEQRFLELCERCDLPIPEVNAKVRGRWSMPCGASRAWWSSSTATRATQARLRSSETGNGS